MQITSLIYTGSSCQKLLPAPPNTLRFVCMRHELRLGRQGKKKVKRKDTGKRKEILSNKQIHFFLGGGRRGISLNDYDSVYWLLGAYIDTDQMGKSCYMS